MAEIKRSTSASLFIRSIPSDRMTVCALRDFVKALDAEGVPDRTLLQSTRSTVQHLTNLYVRIDVDVANPIKELPPSLCVAHGDLACTWCAQNPADCATVNGGCTVYAETGMHWDTCPNRIRTAPPGGEHG